MNIVFRTDASIDIGTGHVMRCLSLADSLRESGETCMFVCKKWQGNMTEMIRARGHSVIELPPSESMFINSEEADAIDTLEALHQIEFDWMLVDHYQLGAQWEAIVKPHSKRLMVIDDLANREHICDLLLDQNHGRTPDAYQMLVPHDCQIRTGADHALLRPQFSATRAASLARRADGRLKHILVTMGGIDKDNASSRVLDALTCCELDADCKITVVMGSSSPWIAYIAEKAASMPWQTRLISNVANMAELMCNSDLAITAAGTTLWELCCLGVPIIASITAENQKPSALALQASDALLLVSDLLMLQRELPVLLLQCQSPSRLKELSLASRAITDGCGTHRIAQTLLASIAPSCSIRMMQQADLDLVLAWRNHPDTRQHMLTQHTISQTEHEAWYTRHAIDPTQQLLIVEEEGKPFGFVRLNTALTEKTAEWGFYIAPGMPKGSGKKLGNMTLDYAFDALDLQKLTGSVLTHNTRSIQFHKSLGFVQEAMPVPASDDLLTFGLPAAAWRSRKTA